MQLGPTQQNQGPQRVEDSAAIEQRFKAEVARACESARDAAAAQAQQEMLSKLKIFDQNAARTIEDVVSVKSKLRHQAEAEIVKLSLAIAARIMMRELTIDPDSIQGVVHAALRRLDTRDRFRVRVGESLTDSVRAALMQSNLNMANVEIISDPQMQPGQLLFETSMGELDASIEGQLKEIERGFADRLLQHA